MAILIKDFVLHEVDRDCENGLYGSDRILTLEFGDMKIEKVENDYVFACELKDSEIKRLFQLKQNTKSNRELYKNVIVAKWEMFKSRYIDDEDYTDFKPAIYDDLIALKNGKCEIYQDPETGG